MIAVFTTAVILLIGIPLVYHFDKKNNLFVMRLLVMMLFVTGIVIGNDYPKSSKKKITPKIKVECENNKCDTTYIY